ncbi:FAD/NAD(P)-binding protein [Burkholderia pseudomallei]|uniref:FAD/NAD(P)-binding protein n=1 Tax=Burkholderia pseudomallei TaxID=28450 RepID=UPI000F084748|nr:FAD/NAD(P)-binding protein [Burkholderia pseudomallei]CAJ3240197.1 FAD dependent oxidoreductase [Burkholderia pseudomallei]VCF09694.1 FAD dependent oxidoreductase [Burkholderia pseudomallei]VCF11639.1 FAD dependent oxidoreductase [Burkholderia pseudomallei]VCF24689.1 FAD dependent oxidoreductase [Burkholderia pseudomallei]VCF51439.1 FAD dependent oxidoreductase [Burkholderia pseudomallei]
MSTTTVAIIGAGFCGATLATHLLRRPPVRPMRVLLINRSGAMARGVAYGTRALGHLLNVPAGRMSAVAGDDDDFYRYASGRDPRVARGSFVPRRIYGDYLEARLTEAIEQAHAGIEFRSVVGSAVRIAPVDGGARGAITMDGGAVIEADRVVLSSGNEMRRDPFIAESQRKFYDSHAYVRDPWRPGALRGIAPDTPVLLVGSGLTMMDVVLDLRARGHAAPIHVVSRHGLMPLAHREMDAPPSYDDRLAARMLARADVRHYVRAVRDAIRRGGDWRDVIGSLRAATPALWRQLPSDERRRFLRHVRPYWDVHRHRCAPEPAARLQAEFERGGVAAVAGRVTGYSEHPNGVGVTVRRRGAAVDEHLEVGAVVNCTGPAPDFSARAGSLLGNLYADGLIVPDAIGMGFEIADDGAVLDRDGSPSAWLRYVGPLLQARDWEATAVPELRQYVQRLADTLLAPRDERALT